MTAAMPNDLWNLQMSAAQVDETFNPADRFRDPPRLPALSAERRVRTRARATARIVRRYAFSTAVDVQTDMQERPADTGGRSESVRHQLSFAGLVLGRLSPNSYERLDEPFTIESGHHAADRARVHTQRSALRASTANRRVVAVSATIETGGFYSGTKQSVTSTSRCAARPAIIVYASTELNDVDLPEGAFTTRLYRLVGEDAVQPVDRAGQQLPVRLGERACLAGSRASAGSCGPAATSTSSTRTTGWTTRRCPGFTTLDRRIASKVLYTHRF